MNPLAHALLVVWFASAGFLMVALAVFALVRQDIPAAIWWGVFGVASLLCVQ